MFFWDALLLLLFDSEKAKEDPMVDINKYLKKKECQKEMRDSHKHGFKSCDTPLIPQNGEVRSTRKYEKRKITEVRAGKSNDLDCLRQARLKREQKEREKTARLMGKMYATEAFAASVKQNKTRYT